MFCFQDEARQTAEGKGSKEVKCVNQQSIISLSEAFKRHLNKEQKGTFEGVDAITLISFYSVTYATMPIAD